MNEFKTQNQLNSRESTKEISAPSGNELSFEQFQTPTEVIIIAYLPSIVKEEIKLEGNSESITIKIVGPSDSRQLARMGYYAHEVTRIYGFSKTFHFTTPVDQTRTKATFKHGVMEIRIPKK